MPTSVPYCVPIIASVARQLRPASVLDVGVGFGKYGFVFREYLDIWDMQDVHGYDKARWKTRIEGIEATREYLTPLHDYIYDKIHIGDAMSLMDSLGQYDVIVMGDVLEHFDKAVGRALLDKLYARAKKCLLLTFPEHCSTNHDRLGNPYEAHRSSWGRKDFRFFTQVQYKLLDGYTALVAVTRPPHDPPLLTPCFAARRRHGFKALLANLLVHALGSINASRLVSLLTGRSIALRA